MSSTPKALIKSLNQRPILFHPIYQEMMGTTFGGVLLSQLMFWFEKTNWEKLYKTNKEFRKETGLSRNEMDSAKKKLKTLPFLKITREGVPPKTFYEIDIKAYSDFGEKTARRRQLYDCEPVNCMTASQSTVKEHIHKLHKKKHTVPPGNRAGTKRAEKKKPLLHPRWIKYAHRLHTAVFKETRVNRSHLLSKWAKQFSLLHSRDGVEIARIRKVLGWYCKELPTADKWMPIAYCGSTFREKFHRLESKMKRALGGKQKTTDYSRGF